MANTSTIPDSHNNSLTTTTEIFSKEQVIAWSCAFASEAVIIVVGNLLTIVLFTFSKKLRSKKSLYLVMNMAFADLFVGGVFLPICVYVLVAHNQLILTGTPTFLQTTLYVSSNASFITAALISAERFYAIYWPLKHRTLSTRAHRLVILTTWTLAILVSAVYLLLFRLNARASYAFTPLYGSFLVVAICGLNISIWRKFQQKTVPCHQNRAMQTQRLTKTLLYVSVVTLSSWITVTVQDLISIFAHNTSSNIVALTFFIYFSSSFINPVIYALKIPDFRQALNLLCFRRREMRGSEGNLGRANMAANHNNLQLTFEQEIMEDTKL